MTQESFFTCTTHFNTDIVKVDFYSLEILLDVEKSLEIKSKKKLLRFLFLFQNNFVQSSSRSLLDGVKNILQS